MAKRIARQCLSAVLLAAALASASCAGSVVQAPRSAAAAPPTDEDVSAQARPIVDAVVHLRGLAELRPITVHAVDDATFATRFEAELKRTSHWSDGAPEARSPDFRLAFYDTASKSVILRQRLPDWARAATVEQSDVLAHEITHALQDQHFGISQIASIHEADRLLAVRALYEGDAQLVMTAYRAKRQHRSWTHAVLRAGEYAAMSTDLHIRAGLLAPGLSKLPREVRATIGFPYESGLVFASTLFRTGGFALIDRAFGHPPESTADVLEPERYLRGERAALIAPFSEAEPGVPIGEFALSQMLAGLLPPSRYKDARAAVIGWNGARLLRLAGPDGKAREMLLATEWSNERTAAQFEGALPQVGTTGPAASGGAVALAIRREGTSVGIAVGGNAQVQVQRCLHRAQPAEAKAPPFGALTIPPPAVPLGKRLDLRGVVTAATYQSRWLGLTVLVPEGFTAVTTKPEAQLLIVHPGKQPTVGAFVVLEGEEDLPHGVLHRAAIGAVVSSLPGQPRQQTISSGPARTPLGLGTEETWQIETSKGTVFVRSVAVNACDGFAVLMWLEWWSDVHGKESLDGWVRSFARAPEPSPRACADMRRELAEEP
jgi:hypothetical protein